MRVFNVPMFESKELFEFAEDMVGMLPMATHEEVAQYESFVKEIGYNNIDHAISEGFCDGLTIIVDRQYIKALPTTLKREKNKKETRKKLRIIK